MKHLSGQRYSRYVGILKEKNKRFSLSPTRRPRGYVQIDVNESSVILTIQVKNLRPINFQPYEIWMVHRSDGRAKPIYIGVLPVDNKGEGENRLEFDSENVKGTGLNIDNFSNVIVTNIDQESLKKRKKQVALDGELEVHMVDSFNDLNVEKVDPFTPAIPNHQWWKFYPGSLLDGGSEGKGWQVSVNHSEPASNPGPVFRGHQLIGLHYDEKGAVSCLVHGIPGRFCAEDQPDGGNSGYAYWHPLPGQRYQGGHYGYWLIHIDPESGEVIYPKEQTPPPAIEEDEQEDSD